MQPTSERFTQVYYVERAGSQRPLNHIAIRPVVRGNQISWEDTARGTTFKEVQKILVEPSKDPQRTLAPSKITIITHDGEEIVLKELTLDLFNERVKSRVAGKPHFDSSETLRRHYLTTNWEPD